MKYAVLFCASFRDSEPILIDVIKTEYLPGDAILSGESIIPSSRRNQFNNYVCYVMDIRALQRIVKLYDNIDALFQEHFVDLL